MGHTRVAMHPPTEHKMNEGSNDVMSAVMTLTWQQTSDYDDLSISEGVQEDISFLDIEPGFKLKSSRNRNSAYNKAYADSNRRARDDRRNQMRTQRRDVLPVISQSTIDDQLASLQKELKEELKQLVQDRELLEQKDHRDDNTVYIVMAFVVLCLIFTAVVLIIVFFNCHSTATRNLVDKLDRFYILNMAKEQGPNGALFSKAMDQNLLNH